MMAAPPFGDLEANAYSIIAADCPWKFLTRSDKGKGRSADKHYHCMTLADIRALPVSNLAAKDCILFFWVTDPFLKLGMEIMEQWGFPYATVGFTWAKLLRGPKKTGPPVEGQWSRRSFAIGQGYYTRSNPEMCLIGKRGHPYRLRKDVRQFVASPLREHSRKPDEIYADIRSMYAGRALEMFARTRRPGYDCWGNEIEKFENLEAAE